MQVAASTRCFSDLPIAQACFHLDDMGYDKVELWLDEQSDHLKPSEVLVDPER
ncbi:MAG: sugar phosphate isomerase/epimerase, partial [Planctomycetaceae bacterium]